MKKQKLDPIESESEEPKLRPVRLDLTPEIHRLLRLVSADKEVSMASYAREALGQHLRDEAKKLGIKVGDGK